MLKSTLGALVALLTLAANSAAFGGTFAGKVQDSTGQPIAGALVTITDARRGLGESV